MIHYRAISIDQVNDAATIEQQLNALANEGYRLVHAQGMLFVMERDDKPPIKFVMDEIKFGTAIRPKKQPAKRDNGLARKTRTQRA